ncbi:Decarboxylase orsB [Lasiodiplodia theobromae]|uniref:Decarboxylase orsB n=1 Tax=Lasiodiplodia theobromae TaxID=45133 RepID=A0A5N5DCI4_9PEZI|nr:Decarboxylase orsB [Lasiodiplodia theobromae]
MATCKLMRTSARQSWIILSESSLGRRSFSYSSKTASSSPRSQSHKPSIPAITLEEHFLTASSAAKLGSGNRSPHDALSEVTGRDLRKGLIDSSPTPAEAAAINDELHAATQAHPDRFVGFAGAADGGDPVAAPRELRRAVTELGVHILRLYASGLFDAHPEVKLVIGHMGETLPMMIGRIGQWQRGFSGAKRSFEDVWKKNIYVTTSGFFDVPPLKLLLDTLPADHIMYSVDYPFGSNEQGAEFLKRIEKENVFEKYGGEEAYRGFLRGNAEKLLKLREKGITSA